MPPKLKYFPADLALEPRNQCRCRDHNRHTERHCHYGNAYDDPGEVLLPGKGDTAGNEEWQVQMLNGLPADGLPKAGGRR